VEVAVGFGPLAVEIESSQISPEVAVDHAVYVDHRKRHHLETSQQLLLLQQRPQQTFDDEGAHCFSGVLSGKQDDFAVSLVLLVLDPEVGDGIVGNGMAEDLSGSLSGSGKGYISLGVSLRYASRKAVMRE
jgi:hypothetical protein